MYFDRLLTSMKTFWVVFVGIMLIYIAANSLFIIDQKISMYVITNIPSLVQMQKIILILAVILGNLIFAIGISLLITYIISKLTDKFLR
jgi:hypothetical protein